MNNPVAKNLYAFNKPKMEGDKRRKYSDKMNRKEIRDARY